MDLVSWLLHELFLQLYLVFTHSCAHEWSETCPCKIHKILKCLLNHRTPEAISLCHNNILPDRQSYFRVGLVSVFLIYFACMVYFATCMVYITKNIHRGTQMVLPRVWNISLTQTTVTSKARHYFTPNSSNAASLGVVSRVCNTSWTTLLKKSLQNCVKQLLAVNLWNLLPQEAVEAEGICSV